MPQTLLAFVAIMLVTTYTLSVQQQYVFNQQKDVSREIEEMAGSVALEVMEVISARPFDQAVLDGTVTGTLDDLPLFSFVNATDHFTTGHACSVFGTGADLCDDLDDFHKMQTALIPFAMGVDTVYFNVDVEVYYVDDNLERVDDRSFNKAVTVTVKDTWPGSDLEPYLAQPIELSRIFSYEF